MWDERYGEEGYAYGERPNDFLKSCVSYLPAGGKVLCLAEGHGRNAVFLAENGFQVTAIDQSKVGLEKARQFAESRGVQIETIQGDLAEYELGTNQWDAIVSISAHTPTRVRSHIHSQVLKALVPGGVFLLEAYCPNHLSLPGVGGPAAENEDFFMPLFKLETELSGLEFKIAQEIIRHMEEGKYHHGLSGVVQILGVAPKG